MKDLMKRMPQSGTLEWIGIRSGKKAVLDELKSVQVVAGKGLAGDHYTGKSGKRSVTLIQQGHLNNVSEIMNKTIDPQDTRRNLVVSGINLLALINQRFRIGEEVVLEGTGHCHPCSRMETNLGPGGYNAMRGHGGLTARVISGGTIKLGDKLIMLAPETTT